MKVLMLEDDRLLAGAVRVGLSQAGHVVDWISYGRELDAALSSSHYDALLLDLGLPDVGGEVLLRGLRVRRVACPVIVVTARGRVQDRVDLLDMGADDYLVKPFDLDELAARLRAVARRTDAAQPMAMELEHGPLKLCSKTRSATWHGRPVQFHNREFSLLDTLLRQRNRRQLVSRSELEEALYGWGQEVESNVVEVHIHHVRRKLCPEFIETVRGQGYRLGVMA